MLQSFLILGHPDQRRHKSLELLKSYGSKFSKNSPDITLVTPIKKTTTIGQIREIKSQIHQKPLRLPFKFVILEDACTLNKEAQNALLKILEEPPSHAIIILEAGDKSGLLPTILSRVATLWAKSPMLRPTDESLLDLDESALLAQIGAIDNAEKWLDDQIIALYEQLNKYVKGKITAPKFSQITTAIENCKEAKKLIIANVNPKFVLISLVLSQS